MTYLLPHRLQETSRRDIGWLRTCQGAVHIGLIRQHRSFKFNPTLPHQKWPKTSKSILQSTLYWVENDDGYPLPESTSCEGKSSTVFRVNPRIRLYMKICRSTPVCCCHSKPIQCQVFILKAESLHLGRRRYSLRGRAEHSGGKETIYKLHEIEVSANVQIN